MPITLRPYSHFPVQCTVTFQFQREQLERILERVERAHPWQNKRCAESRMSSNEEVIAVGESLRSMLTRLDSASPGVLRPDSGDWPLFVDAQQTLRRRVLHPPISQNPRAGRDTRGTPAEAS